MFHFFGGGRGQDRRTSHMPPSLQSPLIFKAKFKIFVILPLINSNGLLTLRRLLSLKVLLPMTTSFIKEKHFNNYISAIHEVQNYNKT